MNKAIFLDKDGILATHVTYNTAPNLIKLEDNIIEGLQILQEEGFKLIVVTNQAGVALGYLHEKDLDVMKENIRELLAEENIRLGGFYYCPHHPQGTVKKYAISCDCRKPMPGMLYKAAEQLHIDLAESWLMGDMLNDVEAGNRAGCRTILIDKGHEKEWEINEKRIPDLIVQNVNEAAKLLLIADELLLPRDEVSMLGFT